MQPTNMPKIAREGLTGDQSKVLVLNAGLSSNVSCARQTTLLRAGYHEALDM